MLGSAAGTWGGAQAQSRSLGRGLPWRRLSGAPGPNRRKMNQLQALLNDSLVRTKHVENAAIINIKERQVCASTFGFNVPPENALNLIYAFCKNLLQVRRGGLYFKEKYYKCVRADEHSIYLQNPDGGLIVVKTKTFILVATYGVGMYPSVCVEAVEKLADYLREKGS